ncbi:DUF1641 domain-containing protein [Staphylococcus aureus]|nr:DUF1641 domain-containing protein [Staphylococcus aureus]
MAERISSKIRRLEKSEEQIKLESLSDFLNKVNKGLHVANQASPNAKTSVRSLLGVLKDDDMNRSLTYMLNMLKGMSRED